MYMLRPFGFLGIMVGNREFRESLVLVAYGHGYFLRKTGSVFISALCAEKFPIHSVVCNEASSDYHTGIHQY